MATDYMRLTEFFMDELPADHPWQGNIKELVEKLLDAGITFKRDSYAPFTNGDKMRLMNDKELAAFLAGKFTDHSTQLSIERGVLRNATSISAEADLWFRVWMQWLRLPASGENNGS